MLSARAPSFPFVFMGGLSPRDRFEGAAPITLLAVPFEATVDS